MSERVCVPLDGNVHIGDIMQYEFDELFVLVLPEVANKRLRIELLPQFIRGQSILSETVVEIVHNCAASQSEYDEE